MAGAAEVGMCTYVGQEDAVKIDEELMGPLGFSVDQLMELAGLSCACSVADVYNKEEFPSVLVLCGPGNNGGDGLVAARHLHHFGYSPTICYPKRTQKELYLGLVTQLESLRVSFMDVEQLNVSQYNLIIDAMFGFSFKGAPRPPFDALLAKLKPGANPPPIASIDIPSGWHVEEGDVAGDAIRPNMLISLTAPKKCAQTFTGEYHYLGGRFVPPHIKEKYNLKLPAYPGCQQFVRL